MAVISEDIVKNIIEVIKSVRFGYVQIVIQDSKVVQIDRTEKLRLNNSKAKGGDVKIGSKA